MPKDSSTKYYQDNKERLQKRLVKGVILCTEDKKSGSMGVNDIKITLRMKKLEKTLHYN